MMQSSAMIPMIHHFFLPPFDCGSGVSKVSDACSGLVREREGEGAHRGRPRLFVVPSRSITIVGYTLIGLLPARG